MIIILGVLVLLLFDYEADRALLYYKSLDLEKIYIYRSIDSENLLCGTEKNALSCKFYIVKNKSDILNKKLYIVDKEEAKKGNIENINNGRCRKVIVKICNQCKDTLSILTLISAIVVSTVLYIKGKTHIEDIFVGLLIIGILVIAELSIIWLFEKVFIFLKWILKIIIERKKIAIVIYILILIFRMSFEISIVEWVMHFLILSVVFKPLHICLNYLRNKPNSESKND